jgi:hypothetical protein
VSNNRTTLVVFGGLAVLFVLSCGAVAFGVNYAMKQLPKNAIAGLQREWYSTEPCLVDAKGDGMLDVAGFSGTPDEQTHATALDGRTGQILWETPAFPEKSHAYCADTHALLVSRPGFQLEALDAKTGHRRWAVRFRDEVQDVLPGGPCVEVVLSDMSHAGVDLASGKAAECHGTPKSADISKQFVPDSKSPSGLAPFSWSSRAGDVDVRVTSRAIGTQVLDVTATRAGKALWTKRLDIASDFTTPPFVGGTKDVIVVAAYDLVDKEKLVWIGLDASTGKQLYRVQEASHWSHFFFHAKMGGGTVYSYWGCGMFAYDAKTGAKLWSLGGR